MKAAAENGSAAFLLLWNPDKFAWDDLPQKSYAWCVRQTALGQGVEFAWRIGHSRQIRGGDRLYLLRTNRQRGLIGAGHAVGDVHRANGALLAPLKFDALLPADNVLPVDTLRQKIAGVAWNRQYASGNRVPPPLAEQVERLWQRHLRDVAATAAKAVEISTLEPCADAAPNIALSVRQPHLEAILRGVKREEYRSVPTTVRGPVYLYATKARYEPAEERTWLLRYGLAELDADCLPRGVLAGTVEIIGCRRCRGGYAWELAQPRRAARLRRPTGMPQPMWFRPFG